MKPAFVALPKDLEDIQRCLACSFMNSVPCIAKSGGHSTAGYSTINGTGFVINLSRMKKVSINGDRALIQAGARWKDVYDVLNNTQYVVTGGICPDVGIAGFTMGGGYSHLSRKFGLAIDNVVSMTMVLANGSGVIIANESQYPDLFWALRGGGGGNFGIVTDITFKLHQAAPNYVFGFLKFKPGSQSLNALTLVGKSFFPNELFLDMFITSNRELTILPLFEGSFLDLSSILKELIDIAISSEFKNYASYYEVISQDKRYMSPTSVYPIYQTGCILDQIGADVAQLIFEKISPDGCTICFNHLGGKIADFGDNVTSYYYRDANFSIYIVCTYQNEQEEAEVIKFEKELFKSLEDSGHCIGNYVNDMDRLLDDWLEKYYGGNLRKLEEVKANWNPVTVGYFHFPQEIK